MPPSLLPAHRGNTLHATSCPAKLLPARSPANLRSRCKASCTHRRRCPSMCPALGRNLRRNKHTSDSSRLLPRVHDRCECKADQHEDGELLRKAQQLSAQKLLSGHRGIVRKLL